MDEDNNPDRLLSEPPEFSPGQHQHQRTGSMSLGAAPNLNGDDVSPINGDSTGPSTMAGPPPTQADPNARAVNDVVNSEIGVQTLLNRLKQSVASAKASRATRHLKGLELRLTLKQEFALFLKKRSTLEEEHSNGLKKICRVTAENIRKPEHRHGSFLQSSEEVTMIHERMADNGAQFAISLHQMHEDLLELVANIERNRKHWKTTGLASEQRVADTEAAMRKSKAKYDSLADDYDRARTGDRQAGKKFGLKGPKSAAQHEEDLLRKVQAADADYSQKVQTAQSQRAELLSKLRPEAVKAVQDLIKECDSALTLQMQKFASFNEKLLLSNGLNVSPLKGQESTSNHRSLREAVYSINNDLDFSNYLSSYAMKVPPRTSEIKYERNAVLNPSQQPSAPAGQRQSDPAASYASRQGPPQGFAQEPTQSPHQTHVSQPFNSQAPSPAAMQPHERSFSQGSPSQQYNNVRTGSMGPAAQMGSLGAVGGAAVGGAMAAGSMNGPPRGPPQIQGSYSSGPVASSGPPQISTLPFQTSQTPPPMLPQPPPGQPLYAQPSVASQPPQSQAQYGQPPIASQAVQSHLPPLKPVFGLSLMQLFERDGSAVPMVIHQCIQGVDLFGLEVEGIYRLSGTSSHVTKLKAMFDNDSTKVDFRNPESFFHDVNSVAGLLKQFLRDLPDPLLTVEHYGGFIEASKHEDDIVRRDSLHAIINSLPDPNYATLRALTLHLNRVQEASSSNRMNASNLAIVFGPTLMGASSGPNIQDAGWQVRVIDTILNNTYQIFDDD